MKRLDNDYSGRNVLERHHELPGKRKRGRVGRAKRRYLDVVKEDMPEVGATEDDVLTEVYGESAAATSDGKKHKKKKATLNSS